MKIHFTILLFLLSINSSLAQKTFIQEKFHQLYFQGIGMEFDYTLFPLNTVVLDNETYYNQWESFGLNLSVNARLNILELGNEQAISISTQPYLGLIFGMNRQIDASFGSRYFRDVLGVGSLGLPILLNYHIGKNATNQSTSRFGLNLSFGKEYILNPLFTWQDSPTYKIGLKSYYEGLLLKLGIIREKKRLHEFYVRAIIFENRNPSFFSSLQPYYFSPDLNFSLGITFFQKK